MSIPSLYFDPAKSAVKAEDVNRLAAKLGFAVNETEVPDYHMFLSGLDEMAQSVLQMEDYQPVADLKKYPRGKIEFTNDPHDGWATKVAVKSTTPVSSLLQGKRIIVKDNIAVAQVPMVLGTKVVEGFVPQVDATVVTRVLDAGAMLVGKATCENLSASANSFSSASGYIDNPYARGYSSGGSSSGCGRLPVVDDNVDMAIGGDQGGSVRIPSSFCGLVGLKPTYGLVPYSGIVSLEPTIDHTGPMTKTVMDNALLLEAIAGLDGMDDRQVGTPSVAQIPHYSELLKSSLGLKGTRVAILNEGFNIVTMQPSVATKVRQAISKFTELGATVDEVSMPMHLQAGTIWAVATRSSTCQGLLANPMGRRQLYMTELIEKFHPLTQDMVNAMFPSAVNMILNGLYLDEKYGSSLYAKAMNLVRKLRDEYDSILAKYDVIMLPTLPFPANRHAEPSASPLEKMSKSVGLTLNTAPFNCTGHPALSLPCGFVPAVDNAKIMLPCGLQIVGKAFDERTIYRFAYAWEQANDWKKC